MYIFIFSLDCRAINQHLRVQYLLVTAQMRDLPRQLRTAWVVHERLTLHHMMAASQSQSPHISSLGRNSSDS